MTSTLTLRRPDDWHLHLRDDEQLRAVVGFTAQRFGRAIVMPNLEPPVVSVEMAGAYRKRILDALPVDCSFEPLMTLYLTEQTPASEIEAARRCGFIHAAKLYPAGATTHSAAGVRSVPAIYPILERMEAVGLPLLVHGEVTDPGVDVFERETRFIETTLAPLIERFRRLKVVFEHITTRDGALFVRDAHAGIAATITPQHLLLNRNALFHGGLRPHHYCLPVLKGERDRETLLEAATSGNAKFFLGTDSAPHSRSAKESDCGCAGVFSSHAGIELYAEAFESVGKLDRLQGFASEFGADFYGLPRNSGTISLVKQPWEPPAEYPFGSETLVPLRAGTQVQWRLQGGGY